MTMPTVREVMTRGTIAVRDDVPLAEAAKLLDKHRISGVPVVDRDGYVVGVLSQTDLLRARFIDHLWSVFQGLSVRHLMTAPAVTATADASIEEAAALMERNQIHRLVVVDADGRTPVGILSVSDLIHQMASR
jgi:CBS domain-containing protein